MGPYYQAFPEGGSLTLYEDDPARTRERDRAVVAQGRPRLGALERLAGRPGRRDGAAADARCRPTSARTPPATSPTWRGSRGATAASTRRTVADADPADDDEHRGPARRLVRVAADQGRARGQRRHRHLGRTLRAGYGVRHGAPLDRRRGRRPARLLGLPRGRDGRGLGRDPAGRRVVRGRGPHVDAAGRVAAGTAAGSTGAVLGVGRGDPRAGRRDEPAPADRVPRPRRRGAPARRLRPRHRALETRSGVVKVNLALDRLPTLHRRPRATARPSTTPARSRWRRPWSSSSGRSSTPARAGPPCAPFSDGVIPTTLDKTLNPDGTHIFSLFTQWVPADWTPGAAPRGARRPTPTG